MSSTIFAYLWRVMKVKIGLFGLAILLCAQTATAWKWYAYTQENNPSINISPVSTIWSAQKGVVRALADTIYVMGTYQGQDGANINLPDTSGSGTNPAIPGEGNYVRTYLGAYDRQTGAIMWWMWFYHSSGGTWGQDLAVASGGVVYLLLIGHPQSVSWEYRDRAGNSRSGSVTPLFSGDRSSYILRIVPYDPSSTFLSYSAIGLTNSSGACDLKHLLLVGNELYAAGEWKANSLSAVLREEGTMSIDIFSPIDPLNDKTRALIVRWRVTPTFEYLNAGQLRYEGTSTYRDVTGHRIAYDAAQNKLRWLFEAQDSNSPMNLVYQLSSPSGTYSSPGITGSSYTLRVLSLDTNLSSPPVLSYHNLAYTNTPPAYDTPPYLHAHNDTITWCRAASYPMNVINESFITTLIPVSGPDYVAVIQQTLLSASNNAKLSRHTQISGATGLHLSALATERRGELLYLTGASNGQQWGAGPLGNRMVSRSGFLLGLRASGTGYSMIGYRRFYGIGGGQDSVEAIGMAYDTLRAQFYILGTAEDSLLLEPVWPMGQKDTIRPSSLSNIPERLWLGRLDWYRLMTSGNYTHCAPDSITSTPVAITVTGKNMHSTDVPPNTPAGWRFGWIPAQTPWKSTTAPLDIIGPIMGNQEGQYAYGLHLLTKGAYAPGDYYLVGTVYPVLQHQWADLIDTLRLTVPSTTIPPARRTTSTASTFMVAPYAGRLEPSAPYITGPYPRYRYENWKFKFINALYYHPYYYDAPAYRGEEMLFVITHALPHQIWGINLRTGMVDSMPVADPNKPHRYFMDPVRGTYWAHERPGNPISTMHIRRAPFTSTSEALIHQGTTCVTTPGNAYPLRYTQAWLENIHRAAVLPNGDFVFIADACPNARYSLWRVSLATDSVYRVTGFTTLGSTCPQDGSGNTAIIGYFPFTNLAVWGDTIFWIQNAFSSSCLSQSGNRLLIRKAYPYGSITTYKVETLDTILYLGSVAEYLLFSPLPSPGLIFGTYASGQEAMIRYDLYTRSRDTLIRCLTGGTPFSTLCCQYGLSDWITGLTHTAALLRGGAIVIERNGSVNIAVPIALSGSGDTLITSGPIGSVSSTGGTPVAPTHTGGSTFKFAWPAAGGPGLDSTYLRVTLSSCGNGKAFYYPFYHLPRFRVWLKGPDTVCVGQVFHTYVGRDTEVVESSCRVSYTLFMNATSAQGHLVGMTGKNESHRWRATQSGYDTIKTVLESAKWRYLVLDSALSFPVRIRQGHRLRLSVALEGPYEATTFLHRWHPFLTRYNLGAYNQRILGVSSDSLWRLPYPPGDSLMKNWNMLLGEPIGPCPGTGTWYCSTPWATLARVELRESPTGPVVDSTYALVDSAGWLTAYAAPLGNIVGHGDTLHFCHCDPATAKHITVRFPNHLPLHTPAIGLPVRGVGEADSLDLRDPTYLEGIPGEHYTFVPGPGGTVRAAAWAGNCADLHNAFIPGGAHVDAGWINAADYDFVITRNGITSGFSIADINSDGVVNSLDAVIVISNQNALRQSSRP